MVASLLRWYVHSRFFEANRVFCRCIMYHFLKTVRWRKMFFFLFFLYKQKSGKMNKNGNKTGTIKSDAPQVQVLPTMAVIMIQRIVKLTMKHPPRLRYCTNTVQPSWNWTRSLKCLLPPHPFRLIGLPLNTK